MYGQPLFARSSVVASAGEECTEVGVGGWQWRGRDIASVPRTWKGPNALVATVEGDMAPLVGCVTLASSGTRTTFSSACAVARLRYSKRETCAIDHPCVAIELALLMSYRSLYSCALLCWTIAPTCRSRSPLVVCLSMAKQHDVAKRNSKTSVAQHGLTCFGHTMCGYCVLREMQPLRRYWGGTASSMLSSSMKC